MTSVQDRTLTVVLTLVVLGLLAALLPGESLAQVASPVASPGGIDPALCTVEPRPVEDLLALPEEIENPNISRLLGTPVATRVPPSGGTAASPDVVVAVTEVMLQSVACFNAFDFPRMTALVTDERFFREFSGPGADTDPAVLDHLMAPHPFPRDRWTLLYAVEDVRVLPNGRVTAVVSTDQATALVVLVERDGRYLIDDGFEIPVPGRSAVRTLVHEMAAILVGHPFGVSTPAERVDVSATPGTLPTVPDPDACQVAPRPMSELAALSEAPPGDFRSRILGTPVPSPTPTPTSASVGAPTAPLLVSAITAVVEEQIACINAGDLPRFTALWSDDFLRWGLGGLAENAFAGFETSAPPLLYDRITLVSVRDVRTLPDGHITAVIQTDTGTSQWLFIESGGRYLIDESIELSAAAPPDS